MNEIEVEPDKEDEVWMNSDLSSLGSYEPYDWQSGEIEGCKPVCYIPGVGIAIEES